jgi:FkbM family methyltransferase
LDLYRRSVEGLIHTITLGLMKWHGMQFPPKAVGGWWWIWRFRFELLMRWFEWESVQRVVPIVRPGMTVVDIGAHIGYYTRILSELVGPTGQVLAFEPDTENFAVLRRNLSARRYRNVTLFNCAVADRDEVRPFYISPGNSNHSLVPGYTEAQSISSVRCVTLDSVLAERGIEKLDFVKSDTEGGEPLVLAGLARTIASSPQLSMLVEFNPVALRCGKTDPEQFLKSLRELGFEIEMIRADPATKEIYSNILCLKTSPAEEGPSAVRV